MLPFWIAVSSKRLRSPTKRLGANSNDAIIALPTPPGSGGNLASASAKHYRTRSCSALICSSNCLRRPGRLDVMSARKIEQVDQMGFHVAMKPPHGAIGPRRAVLAGAQMIANQKTNGVTLISNQTPCAARLCRTCARQLRRDHENAHHLASHWNFADIMKQRSPAHQRPTHGLLHHLFRVGPAHLCVGGRLLATNRQWP